MERPSGVTILAVLSFLGAALMLLGACGMFLLGATGMAAAAGGRGLGGPLAALGAFAGVAMLILAAIYIVNGIGLWKLQGWSRVLTIVLLVIGILFELLGIMRVLPMMRVGIIIWELILIAIDVWILAYLFKPHVKQAFGQA